MSTHRFITPHRSYLVNYDQISDFYKERIVMSNGDNIPISRLKIKEIREMQIRYEEEK